jgi:hypothetical protein
MRQMWASRTAELNPGVFHTGVYLEMLRTRISSALTVPRIPRIQPSVSARPFRTTGADEKPHRRRLKVRLNADALCVDLLVSSNCPYGHDVNDELVTILSDRVPELPMDVHIFLTSCPQMIDIYADANQTDLPFMPKPN